MIQYHGKFLSLNDYFSSDKYKRVLVNCYHSLTKEKLNLVSRIKERITRLFKFLTNNTDFISHGEICDFFVYSLKKI